MTTEHKKRREIVLNERHAGRSLRTIGDDLGLSMDAVSGIIRRARAAGDPRAALAQPQDQAKASTAERPKRAPAKRRPKVKCFLPDSWL